MKAKIIKILKKHTYSPSKVISDIAFNIESLYRSKIDKLNKRIEFQVEAKLKQEAEIKSK